MRPHFIAVFAVSLHIPLFPLFECCMQVASPYIASTLPQTHQAGLPTTTRRPPSLTNYSTVLMIHLLMYCPPAICCDDVPNTLFPESPGTQHASPVTLLSSPHVHPPLVKNHHPALPNTGLSARPPSPLFAHRTALLCLLASILSGGGQKINPILSSIRRARSATCRSKFVLLSPSV
jgi:hypothetical protein